ncbi:aminotransferase class I/II-fold pyridoxal phosphate-dependent enzyme [Pendulispora brunnea]|uniref:Aminotransferase class I/II-fold pyridoxal phosphate-dependent enzyme n=1 Tax=Pendulispora brunnea TaxID=2905690 RepID=A0ABZ2KHR8_9BACT
MKPIAARIRDFPTTVFTEFSALAQKHQAVNLGQGFPDFDGPEEIREAAVRAVRGGVNQYAVSSGAVVLKEAVAEHALRFYGQKVDPGSEVIVTNGATEALFDVTLGLVDPGDEVIVFEPYYDSYVANVTMAGGVPRYVLLRPPDADHARWWYDPAELEAQFTSKTKFILLNTPHNPTGKVFDRAELEHIASLCIRHDVLAVADEVYEHITFEPARHVRLATIPGMAERTITISSGGKSFSFTGWKVGWAIGTPALCSAVQKTHQFVTFAVAGPMQHAIAEALRLPDAYFIELAQSYRKKRDLLVEMLDTVGLRPIAPDGAYFVMAQIGHLGFPDDFEFCRYLTRDIGVAAIPPTAFYAEHHRVHGSHLARFAFCKRDETLLSAREKLLARLSAK